MEDTQDFDVLLLDAIEDEIGSDDNAPDTLTDFVARRTGSRLSFEKRPLFHEPQDQASCGARIFRGDELGDVFDVSLGTPGEPVAHDSSLPT